MTPFETVTQRHRFPEHIGGRPFIPKLIQIETIDKLAPLQTQGHWCDMSTGKTFMATACALYQQGHQTVVIMPPLLITQWAQWLRLITPALSITEYRGTPKERAALSLDNDFVLVGVQIFKKDYGRIQAHFNDRAVTVIVDEANFVSNIGTDTHDKVYEFCIGRTRMLLTGTPANKPGDAYGLLKFTAPGTYRNKKHFENVHVAERDFFDNPIKWQNLDQLKAALETNSVRILFRDMHSAVEKPLYDPIEYNLSPEHYKLYRKLAEEQLLVLPDGGKIDATTSGRLMAKLGQIVCNQDHFSGGEHNESAAIDMVEQKLSELGDGKLVVFANYRMTIAALLRRFVKQGARGINSEVSPKQKDANLEAFKEDPSCRLLAVQFISGGKGLDGLQHVCNHCFFIEPCLQPRDFHQAVARLDRLGQKERVWVGMGIAQGTLQVRGFKDLLANDELSNQIIRNTTDLRAAIFGA